MTDLLILGAGPAGLMAALRLAEAGHHCQVIEASERVGGMAGSFDIAGLRVDFGSHRFHPAAPAPIRHLAETLLGDDLQRRERNGRLRLGSSWVGFPLRTADLLRTVPITMSARLAVDSVRTMANRLGSNREPTTFDQAITATLGPTVATSFYGPYANKLYGLPADALDAELARRRVSAGSPIEIVKRLARASRPAGREFLYPRKGYGQIVERLAEAATDAGVEIHLDQPVQAITVTTDGAAVEGAAVDGAAVDGVTVDTPAGRYPAAAALSTLPVGRLAQLLTPGPPADVTAALARRRTRAMLLVYLVLDRGQYTPFDAHYIPGSETPVARLSEPKNYRDGDDPADRTVLCAEIPCWPDDDLVAWSADDLGRLVADGLERLGLPAVAPVEVETRLLPSVYPVFDRDGIDDRSTIDRWLGQPTKVLSLGRQGIGAIDNLHHVLAMGADAAAAVGPDGSIQAEHWQRSLASHAANTVED